jgi:hypothetical protein
VVGGGSEIGSRRSAVGSQGRRPAEAVHSEQQGAGNTDGWELRSRRTSFSHSFRFTTAGRIACSALCFATATSGPITNQNHRMACLSRKLARVAYRVAIGRLGNAARCRVYGWVARSPL